MSAAQARPFSVFRLALTDVAQAAAAVVPPLSFASHKGAMGRIGVVGGSRDYTGAPYYAAASALKFGADLAFVFCSELAAVPIKCYSPELMVTPIYQDFALSDEASPGQEVGRALTLMDSFLPRLHTLVLGPGLGRGEGVVDLISGLVKAAKQHKLAMVIDADGLWAISQQPAVVRGASHCVLTPNAVEFDRLVDAAKALADADQSRDLADPSVHVRARALASVLNVTVLRKGAADVITSGGDVFVLSQPEGSPRRCGGQGDILSGSLATALHWARVQGVGAGDRCWATGASTEVEFAASVPSSEDAGSVQVSVLAAAVVRAASGLAFAEHGRAMTSPDVLNCLGRAFQMIAK